VESRNVREVTRGPELVCAQRGPLLFLPGIQNAQDLAT